MKSRDDVLRAALMQLNEDPASSMADLADAMGISRATLHRHFDTRVKLLRELADRGLDRWAQAQRDAGILDIDDLDHDRVHARTVIEDSMIELLRKYTVEASEFGFLLTDNIVVQDPAISARSDELVDREAAFFARAQEVGLLRRDVSPRWLSHCAYGVLVSAREALRVGDVPVRGLDDLVITTFLEGVRHREQ